VSFLEHLLELWRGPNAKHFRHDINREEALFKAKSLEIQMSKLVSSELTGDYASAFLGQGLSFSELRDYQPGDDPRNIQWNVTARFGRPFVKVFREERQLRVVLLLDTSHSVLFTPRNDQALEFGALLFSVSQKNQDQVGFGTFSDQLEDYIPPKSGRPHYRRVLFELSRERQGKPATDFPAVMKEISKKLPKHSNIFIVSDFEGTVVSDEFAVVARAHDVTCIYLPGRSSDLSSLGMVHRMAPESNVVQLSDTSSDHYLRLIADEEEKRWQEISRLLRVQGAEVIRFENDAFHTLDLVTRERRKKRR